MAFEFNRINIQRKCIACHNDVEQKSIFKIEKKNEIIIDPKQVNQKSKLNSNGKSKPFWSEF